MITLRSPCCNYLRCNPFHRLRSRQLERLYHRPSFAPKPVLDLKHIRENPGLYEQDCIDRNYPQYASNGWRILELHDKLVKQQREVVNLRQRNNVIGKSIGQHAERKSEEHESGGGPTVALLEEAKSIKAQLGGHDAREKQYVDEMERLALELPNLSSQFTPVGQEPELLGYINENHAKNDGVSHLEIGKRLDILDFEASATTSGWGWYFLKNEGVFLEQALIQYALSVARDRGWQAVTPPSLVYAHIASACGFMPRDQHGETQVYGIAQHNDDSPTSEKPSLVLAGTAEIPLAGSKANCTLRADELPTKYVGPSRSYRAEAGARGVDTKGLYRVHEFTKVEMFGWTAPDTVLSEDRFGDSDPPTTQAQTLFEEMVDIQKSILTDLGLHARILEMPTADLGASAARKIDIEAFFPSRRAIDDGYGEVTSSSLCTDYQTRRLNTRCKMPGAGKLSWPYTVNGTAMAIPRIFACILENFWDESARALRIPLVLQRWMPHDMMTIQTKPC